METGNIVEYIDRQKIICAVILEIKKQRLRLLTENNREIKLSANRLSHKCKMSLKISMGRDKLVDALKEAASRRRSLTSQINIEDLWEVLNTEQEWINIETMTSFCFSDDFTGDHESAVVRAFFQNRLYFKFNHDSFFPNSEDKVKQLKFQADEDARRIRLIEAGGDWVKNILKNQQPVKDFLPLTDQQKEFVKILQSFYLFEKESRYYELGRAIIGRSGVGEIEKLFDLFASLDIWDSNENIDIYRYEIPTRFSKPVIEYTQSRIDCASEIFGQEQRRDLTGMRTMTIDGQATLDFDDAISFEKKADHYLLGVHIADVGQFVPKNTPLNREALARASSIYMPDKKIPMLPPVLAESQCSLKVGEIRPSVSTMIQISFMGDILSHDIFPSLIQVTDQLTYYDVNMMAEENPDIISLYEIAQKFRQKRLENGAVQISLPEVNVWLDENNEILVSKTNRESPGRMLVSEIMIMANWLTARFLANHNLPAIFRSQPEPRERLYKGDNGSVFQNWMQRKLLSRFVLSTEPERHSGLGLDAYLTATSPIRKYFDLVTQRQIRSIFGLETPYTKDEIQHIIHTLEQPMGNVIRIQNRRRRYWLLKFLEQKIGERHEAIALARRRSNYLVLLTEYMIECPLPLSGGLELRPEDMVQVTIQYVNARKDVLSVFMG